MSFDEQNELTLAQAIESANTGLDAIKRAPIVSYNSGTRCLRIQDISQSKEFENWGFCEVETKNYDKFCLKKGDIMVARTGATIGVNFLIRENLKAVYNNGLIRLRINNQVADYTYIYYNLRCNNYWGHIEAISGGTSTQPNMRINALLDYKILVPPIPQQKAIASILSALDEKIELNNRINKNLEEMAQAIFKSWFVDFEPFQDGEFEDSELGRIPKGWRVGYLGEIIELYDSKRIPLSSRQREGLDKKYPYYGATSIMDYVDKYIFDGIYLLLGEDGSVIDENEYPFLQYVWGKFWVNNHAHVIKGKNGFSEEYLFTLLKKTNVRSIITGAVQLKINQGNLCNLRVLIPESNVVEKVNLILKDIFTMYRKNIEESRSLIETRDSLLPKLMSGEIRVPVQGVS